jgi:hypothetical protein
VEAIRSAAVRCLPEAIGEERRGGAEGDIGWDFSETQGLFCKIDDARSL